MSYRVLIVDDSAVVRAVLKKTIGMTGVPVQDVLQATNGKEALSLLECERIDLLFADLNMPEMNGFEMAKRIFESNDLANRPAVVLVTTETSSTRIDELREMGVAGYVHKPFTPEQIREALLTTLEGCAT